MVASATIILHLKCPIRKEKKILSGNIFYAQTVIKGVNLTVMHRREAGTKPWSLKIPGEKRSPSAAKLRTLRQVSSRTEPHGCTKIAALEPL